MINLSIIDPNWGPQEIINVSLLMMDCGVAVVRRGGLLAVLAHLGLH